MRLIYALQNTGVDFASSMGSSILAKHVIKGLGDRGHQLEILQLDIGHRRVVHIPDAQQFQQKSYVPLSLTRNAAFMFVESGIRRFQRIFRMPYFAFFDSFRFYEACCQVLPYVDLCHEHSGLFSLGAALACRRLRIPYILMVDADPLLELSVVGSPLRGIHALVARWETRFIHQTADRIVCVSQPTKDHLMHVWQVPSEKIAVIPNGVDTDLFSPVENPQTVRDEYGLPNVPSVVFTGSFQLWHGLDILTESFAYVLHTFPNAQLLLIGDGPARLIVERKCKALGIQHAVIFMGIRPHEEIPRLLGAADVAVVPYPRLPQELWFSPLKLYEYMAAGKAIIASRAGQIAEVIRDGDTGLLVPPGDAKALAFAIIELLKNPNERSRLGRRARQQAVDLHSWAQSIKRLEDVYQSVL